MKCYDLNDIRSQLTNDLTDAEAKLKAWQAVTYPTKKDGQPFAIMGKNINGATYRAYRFAGRHGENELTVTAYTSTTGYISDSIHCWENVPDLIDDGKKAKTQNHMPKECPYKALYAYDLDDIKTAVNARCDWLQQYCADLRADLQHIDNAYHAYAEAIHAANAALEATLTNNRTRNTHAYSLIKDTVNHR